MSAATATRRACQACKAPTPDGDDTSLRVLGWRRWDGVTLSGAVSSVTLCPRCCGDEPAVPESSEPTGFHASCWTCMAEISDSGEWDHEGPYSEAECEEWAEEHRCEPEVDITPPKDRS